MGFEKKYYEIDLSTDSTFDVDLELDNNIVYAFGAATGNVAVGVDTNSTPRKGMEVRFIYNGDMDGFTLTVFGTNVPTQSKRVRGMFDFFYNGSAWIPLFIPSTDTAFITNSEVRTSAAIALNKLATLTASRIPQINASGVIEASATNISFLALLGALTEAAADYNKVAQFTGTTDNLNRVAGGSWTAEQLQFLAGVTSNIQTQLNAKANTADFSGILEIKSFNVLIPSAQVLDIFSNPVTIVPAQGANTIIVPISGQGQMIYGTTPYATDGEIDFYCGGSRPVMGLPADDGFLFGTVSRVVNAILAFTSNPTDTQYVANQPLTLKTVGSNPTAGDSDIRAFGTYIVLTL
jgi:hypothetical protein